MLKFRFIYEWTARGDTGLSEHIIYAASYAWALDRYKDFATETMNADLDRSMRLKQVVEGERT